MKKTKQDLWWRLFAGIPDVLLIGLICIGEYSLLQRWISQQILLLPIGIVTIFAWLAIFEASPLMGLPFMRFMGFQVVDEKNRRKLSIPRALFRSFCATVTLLPAAFGFFAAFWDREGRTLYDYASRTMVLRTIDTYQSTEEKAPCLEVFVNGHLSKRYAVQPGGVTVGRDPGSCSVVFPVMEPQISRIHCSINYNFQTQVFLVEDLNSLCGTYLSNGKKIPSGRVVVLRPDSQIRLGVQGPSLRLRLWNPQEGKEHPV